MDMKEIKQLIKLMVNNDLTELEIVEGDNKIELKRGTGGVPVVMAAPGAVPFAAPAAAVPDSPAESPAEPVDDGLVDIKSPMVGTFYAAASPDSGDFVELGATVSDESVVCIIEAMKVMNEIKAECSGTIAEICIDNTQPVEFGQVIYRVKPA